MALSDELSPEKDWCSRKFVEFPRRGCHFKFGNLLHIHLNAIVAAAILDRNILFSSGPDCIYFDRPDHTETPILFFKSWSILCSDSKLNSGRYFEYRPPENAWPLRCNSTYEEFSKFGNLLHIHLNAIVAAAVLDRNILFFGGPDCIYFDRPDHTEIPILFYKS